MYSGPVAMLCFPTLETPVLRLNLKLSLASLVGVTYQARRRHTLVKR